ncbi:MAG: serine/threonine-protein kinase [Bryobacter sp.]|nr:serine/threonine-protein kinase [Bryobacter sp.]
MSPDLWSAVRQQLGEALDLPPGQRAAFLETIADPSVRAEVESLLAAATDEDFLNEPLLSQSPFAEAPLDHLGPYRMEREIGRGGMGTVYLATRDDGEYLGQVAIKILNRGMDTDYFVQRFRYERQLLAYLEHAAIVRLLDGGSTPDGRPFLVTEYIEGGATLLDYIAKHQCTLEEKLKLIIQVAEAVHYAHQRLILHCDIKPNNILVSPSGQPKLLDFGVGRMFLPELGGALQTRSTQRLITPAYASPEQIAGEALTTATDVFSLGATLYELLSGKAPFPARLTDSEAREAPPLLRAVPAEIRRDIGPDLERIVEKSLRPAPAERYESAEQFASDLRRYLAGEPISARPLTLRYQLSRFVRRNRALTFSILLAVVALALGAGIALWQRAEALRERDTARALYENSRQLARAFIFEMDERLQSEGSLGARRLLVERGRAALDQLAAQGTPDAALGRDLVAAYLKLGDVLGRLGAANLGRTAEARASYLRARELSRNLLARYPENEFVREQYGEVLLRISGNAKSQGNPKEALTYGLEAQKSLEAIANTTGKSTLAQLRLLAATYHDLGGTYSQLGQWDEVIRVRRLAIRLNERILTLPGATREDRIRSVLALTRYGNVLSYRNRFQEAEPILADAVRNARAMHQEFPTLPEASNNLSNALMFAGGNRLRQGDATTAMAMYREAHQLRQAQLAANPQDWRMASLAASSLLRYGLALAQSGSPAQNPAKGRAIVEEALSQRIALARRDPDNTGAQAEVGEAWAELALLPGPPAARARARQEALRILNPLAQQDKLNQILLDVRNRLLNSAK